MKQRRFLAGLLLLLGLTGCTAAPTQTADGAPWEERWVRVGSLLGVEPPEDFSLDENKDVLAPSGMFYATWVQGEAKDHTNEDGEAALVYDAQIYVLLKHCGSDAEAQTEATSWQTREALSYETGTAESWTCAGQDFTVLPLEQAADDTNPYPSGIAAFAVRGSWAICVELVAAEGDSSAWAPSLEAFLTGFHYSE